MNQDLERRLLNETIGKLNDYVQFLVRNKRMKQADSFCEEKYAQIATIGFLKKILAYFIEHDENDESCESYNPCKSFESCMGTDLAGIYEFVNAKLPGRVEIVRKTIGTGNKENQGVNENPDIIVNNGNNGNRDFDGYTYTNGNGDLVGKDDVREINITDEYISINVEEGVMLNLQVEDTEKLAVTVCVPAPETWRRWIDKEDKENFIDDPQMPEPDGKEEKAPLVFPISRLGAFCKAAGHICINAHHLNEWPEIRCWRLPEKYMFLDYPKEDVIEKVPDMWWEAWLEEASEEDRSDLEFVKKLISKRGECLKYAPEELKSDRKTVQKAIKDYSYAINFASEEIQNDRGFILENIKRNSELFEDIQEKFRDDKEIALVALKKRISNYQYVSERLKKERDIIEMVAKGNIYYLRYAPTEVLDDKDLAMQIVSKRGDMFEFLSERLRADKDIVIKAVAANGACISTYGKKGIALGYALGGLNNDREVVLAAVRYCGFALECASDELKNDRDMVRIAVENYGMALRCVPEKFQDDREIVLEAVKNDGTALYFASGRLKADKEIILAAVRSAGIEVFDALPEELRNDNDFKIFMLETIVKFLPDFDDYGEFGDGTSEYYGLFEDYEEAFSDIVESIPIELLKENPELVEKICRYAVDVDRAYYEEGSNPYEDSHERLPYTLKDYFEENDIPYSPIIEIEIGRVEAQRYHPKNSYDDLPLEERLFNETADWYDWWAENLISEGGFEANRDYLEPDGGYVNCCMLVFVKEIIKNWEGRYHYNKLWEDSEYEVDLDSAYKEISERLSPKMKVERVAHEFYYSENVKVTVNDKIYFKLVRDCPLKILELWVNEYNSDLERGFWVAPDCLGSFCDMAEYIQDNYARFEKRAQERAEKLKEKYI